MRIAIITVSLLAATAAFAQDPPAADPASPPAATETPSPADPATADAQQPAANAQADADRAAERCRARRSTESRLRSSRRQHCPVAPRADAAAPQSVIIAPEEEEEPAQSPTLPPVSQQPH